MPDPNVTLIAIQSHTAALSGAIQRQSANAGRCKVWSVGVIAGVVFFGVGRAQWAALPWVAGMVILLALADACCVALARRAVEAYNRFMARVPLNGGPSTKAQAKEPEEWLVLPGPDLGIRDAGSVLRALGSFSVWPFYGGLLALVVAFHFQTVPAGEGSSRLLTSSATSSPTKSKPLPATHILSAPTPRPAQPGTIGAPTPGPGTRPGIRPAGSTAQPAGQPPKTGQPLPIAQPPMFSPQKPGQTPPTARIPALPPRPPQTAIPPNSLPAKPPAPTGPGTPQNAVPPQNAASPQTGSPVQNGVPPPNTAPAPAPAGGTPALQPAPPAPPAPSPQAPAVPAGTLPAK